MNELVVQNPENNKVELGKHNMPSHTHHSSAMSGVGFDTIKGDNSKENYFTYGNTSYDMFYNDSDDVGLSKNEMDGAVDKFSVENAGQDETMLHDNMPLYHSFYGFVVKKIT